MGSVKISLQLLKCKNDWSNSLDKGKPVDVVYIDFCKAFDTVSHQKLILKMEKYGITGNLLSWISDFLSERSQQVKVNDSLSMEKVVQSGVPQGSVLGPTLFLMYINDLLDLDIRSHILLFADDVKLYNVSSDNHVLACDLNLISEWSTKWQLKVSLEKCCVLHLGRANPRHIYEISGQQLQVRTEVNDLGVTFSKNLSSSVYCNIIVKKARMLSNLIIRSFLSRNPEIIMRAFLIYVRPVLEYATVVWNPNLKKDIVAVESVQKRFTKRILANKSLSYNQRLEHFSIPSLEQRRIVFDLSMTFDILKFSALPPNDFFEFNKNVTRNIHDMKLCVPKCRLDCKKFDFASRVIKFWNNLPRYVVESNSKKEFLNKLSMINLKGYLQGPS